MKPKASPRPWLAAFSPEDLVLSTFRYFLGRCTIATCCFAQHELPKAWPELPSAVQAYIETELEQAFVRDDASRAKDPQGHAHPLGWDCDRQAWEHVRQSYLHDKTKARRAGPKWDKITGQGLYLRHFDSRMLLVGSFRYHLGRTGLTDMAFARNLAKAWDGLPEIDRNIVRRELEQAFKEDSDTVSDRDNGNRRAYRPLGNAAMRHEWAKVVDVWSGQCPDCHRVLHQCLCSHGNAHDED